MLPERATIQFQVGQGCHCDSAGNRGKQSQHLSLEIVSSLSPLATTRSRLFSLVAEVLTAKHPNVLPDQQHYNSKIDCAAIPGSKCPGRSFCHASEAIRAPHWGFEMRDIDATQVEGFMEVLGLAENRWEFITQTMNLKRRNLAEKRSSSQYRG